MLPSSSNQIYTAKDLPSLNGIRKCFPYLDAYPDLSYLDSAATTQKPASVIRAIEHYYTSSNANIHRGVYALSQIATDAYDNARRKVASFIGARSPNEIVFVKGATEGFNLLAQSFLRPRLEEGDEVILSIAEHHANIIPWQMICQEKKASIRVLPLTEDHTLDVSTLSELINSKTKLISLTHLSNTLGTKTNIKEAVRIAKERGVPVVVDGAQAVSHIPVDVTELDCDFYVFSGHKLYGPTGIGVLYGKQILLKEMPPYQGGGDMIEIVSMETSTFKDPPERFEAGTPPIAGAVGLAEAIVFMQEVGFDYITCHEKELLVKAREILSSIPGIKMFGLGDSHIGPISFIAEWGHPHDIGTILDQHQVAVRTGHHCTQPLMNFLGVSSTVRVSFGIYSTEQDLRNLHKGLEHARKLLT
jgi:cysteine desulfurase / selenocysteine lyase